MRKAYLWWSWSESVILISHRSQCLVNRWQPSRKAVNSHVEGEIKASWEWPGHCQDTSRRKCYWGRSGNCPLYQGSLPLDAFVDHSKSIWSSSCEPRFPFWSTFLRYMAGNCCSKMPISESARLFFCVTLCSVCISCESILCRLLDSAKFLMHRQDAHRIEV